MFSTYDLANQTGTPDFPFGLGVQRCADQLRALADRIESSEYMLQAVTVKTVADREDFPMTHVELVFFEKQGWLDTPSMEAKAALDKAVPLGKE
jgi:hypothetical protein